MIDYRWLFATYFLLSFVTINRVCGPYVEGLVEEKETRTQELMSIMGLQQWTLAAAHAATYAIIFALAGKKGGRRATSTTKWRCG